MAGNNKSVWDSAAVLLTVLLLIYSSGCTSGEKKAEEESVTSDTMAVVDGDTASTMEELPSDTTSENKDTVKDEMIPPPEKQDLAPGTAHLIIEVQDVARAENGKLTLEGTAKQVYGYGSATPPIGSGQQLVVDCTTYFRNSDKYDTAELSQKSISVIVSAQEYPRIGDNDPGMKWSLVRILSVN